MKQAYALCINFVYSQLPNGQSGSGRTAKAAKPQYSTYVNVEDNPGQEIILSEPGRYDLESVFRGMAVGPGLSGVVSCTGISDPTGSSGSIASSTSQSVRLATVGMKGDSNIQCYVTSANETAHSYAVIKPAGSNSSVADVQVNERFIKFMHCLISFLLCPMVKEVGRRRRNVLSTTSFPISSLPF
jgi:hypothetical protein